MTVVHAVFVGDQFYGIAELTPRLAVNGACRKWAECTSVKLPFDVQKMWAFLESEGFRLVECKLEEIK